MCSSDLNNAFIIKLFLGIDINHAIVYNRIKEIKKVICKVRKYVKLYRKYSLMYILRVRYVNGKSTITNISN